MKILQAITELGAGGAEKILSVLSCGLQKRGHEVVVLSLDKPPENPAIPDFLTKNGIRIVFLGLRKSDPLAVLKVRQVIRSEKPDLIHSHLIHANLLLRLAAAGTGIPLCNTIHIAERRPGKGFYFLLDRLTFFLTDYENAVSESAARYHERRCHLPAFSVHTIYNAVDPVCPADPDLCRRMKEEWGLAHASKIIGSIGRLDWQKGYDLLLARISAFSAKIPAGEQMGLVLIGDGPERRKLEILAEKYSSGALKIHLTGFRRDAASLMNLFDVFVMPSRYEGYGLALAEAMTLGLPVVCSTADSLPELCRLYKGASFLVEMEKDPDGSMLDLALRRALNSPRGRGQVLMDADGMTEAYCFVYERLIRRIYERHD